LPLLETRFAIKAVSTCMRPILKVGIISGLVGLGTIAFFATGISLNIGKSVYSIATHSEFNVVRDSMSVEEQYKFRSSFKLEDVVKQSGRSNKAIESVIASVNRSGGIVSSLNHQSVNDILEENKPFKVNLKDYCQILKKCFDSIGMQSRVVEAFGWREENVSVGYRTSMLEVYSPDLSKWIAYDPTLKAFASNGRERLGVAELVSHLSSESDEIKFEGVESQINDSYVKWLKENIDVLQTKVRIKRMLGLNQGEFVKNLVLHRQDEECPSDWLAMPFSQRPINTFSISLFNLHS
jgi:hypothetical protein